MKKMVKFVAFVLAIAVMLCACSTASTPKDDTNVSGNDSPAPVTINMAIKSASEAETIKRIAAVYMEQNPHVTINVNELGRDAYMERIKNQLFAKSSDVDIVNFTNVQIGMFAEAGVIADLSPYINNPELNNGFSTDMFLDAAREAVTYNGSMYGMPYGTSTIMLYYRTDLIDNPPETWEEYLELAKQFTKSHNPDSPTEYGTTMQAKRGATCPKEFSAFLWSHGGDFVNEDGTGSLVNTEGTVEALQMWVDMFNDLKVVPPDVTSYEYAQVSSAFKEGITAMCLQWDAASGEFANPEGAPNVYDKFGVAVIPGVEQEDGSVLHVPFIQSWCFAINEFSENKEEAYKFLAFFSNPDVYLANMATTDSTALKSVLEDASYQSRPGYDAYRASLEQGRPYPNSKDTDRMESALDFAVAQAVAKELTPKEALDNCAEEIESYLAE